MPTERIPFFGSYNRRQFNSSNLDQRVIGGVYNVVKNLSGAITPYLEKRCGLKSSFTPQAGSRGTLAYYSPGNQNAYSAFGASNSTIYQGATSIGTITGLAVHISECTLNSVLTLLITSTNGTGWYFPADALTATAYTADGNNSTTITDIKISGVNSVAGLYIGQKLSAGSNIVAGSRIVSINAGAFTAVLDTATTGGSFNDVAITKEPIAKQNDADFPAGIVGQFVDLDGYIFILTSTGLLYNSDLNTASSWTASNYIPVTIKTGAGIGLFKSGNYIGALKANSLEFFYNAGNAAGSPLASYPQLAKNVGCTTLSGGIRQAYATFEDSVYWIGGGGDLYTLNGNTPTKMSNIGVLPTSASGTVAEFEPYGMDVFRLNGSLIVNIASATANKSRWFFPDQGGIWGEPGLSDCAFISSIETVVIAVLANTDTTGKVYSLDGSTFQDNGAAFTMTVELQTDMGTNDRKTPTAFQVLCDVQASGNLMVSWSDDDGTTYTTPRAIPMSSQIGMNMVNLGSWRGVRKWRFTHNDNTPWRGKSLEIDYMLSQG